MQLPPIDRSLAIAPTAETVANASGAAEPVRPGVTQRQDGRDWVGATQGLRGPDSPSAAPATPNRDWTEVRPTETAKPPEEPPKEPIYKMLMEQIQSIWRAGAQTLDIAEEMQRQANRVAGVEIGKDKQGPLVYTDPAKVRKPPAA
ncbi:hypothetical protein [uncultured Xylophilus sp.]|uniref:hypothetical protein n=1 Tax=uncultured Xylophilus sp. TaxID=296832 RepID=UPI00260008D6|nr:hypothetical protein [uncultured Xylophilus sp.]